MRNRSRRRLLVVSGALLCAPLSPFAQQASRVWRIAILDLNDRGSTEEGWRAYLARMRELGYTEGRNLHVDRRWADGVDGRLPELARELLAGRPDAVLVTTTPATRTVMRLDSTVPIVMAGTADPVATGLVASLSRPGGNVTGVSALLGDIAVKRIDLLTEIVPGARRFGLLAPAANQGVQAVLKHLQEAVRPRGFDVRLEDAADAAGIVRAFDRLVTQPVDALLVGSVLRPHTALIVERAARFRIPAAYVHEEAVEAGGLIAFSAVPNVAYRMAAEYTDRILRGAKPAELPVAQPSEFWLGVNLATARSLGLAIPQSVLIRANFAKQ